jgi:phosphate transport system substrate-binding protein
MSVRLGNTLYPQGKSASITRNHPFQEFRQKGILLKHLRSRALCAVLLLILVLTPVTGVAPSEEPIRISGSTTIQPIAAALASVYESRANKKVVVTGGGSGRGIQDVLEGKSHLGMVSRGLNDEEKTKLQHVTIGYDALVIIVNTANPLETISRDTLVNLYAGKIQSWKKISAWDQPVVLVSKELGRGTLELFTQYTRLRHPREREKYPAGPFISEAAFEVGSNLESITLVGGIPNAIGYVSMGTAFALQRQGMPIKVLALEGVVPSKEAVQNGTYPVIRELNLVFTDPSQVQSLIDLFLSSEGQGTLINEGFIPAIR